MLINPALADIFSRLTPNNLMRNLSNRCYFGDKVNPGGSRQISGDISVKTDEQFEQLITAISEVYSEYGFPVQLFMSEKTWHAPQPTLKFQTHPITSRQEEYFARAIANAGFTIDNQRYRGTENGPFSDPTWYNISSPRPNINAFPSKFPGFSVQQDPDFIPSEERLAQINQTLNGDLVENSETFKTPGLQAA